MDDAKCFAVIRELRWQMGCAVRSAGLERSTNVDFIVIKPIVSGIRFQTSQHLAGGIC